MLVVELVVEELVVVVPDDGNSRSLLSLESETQMFIDRSIAMLAGWHRLLWVGVIGHEKPPKVVRPSTRNALSPVERFGPPNCRTLLSP